MKITEKDIGKKIWNPEFGSGKIFDFDKGAKYPVVVTYYQFPSRLYHYSNRGWRSRSQLYPSIWWSFDDFLKEVETPIFGKGKT